MLHGLPHSVALLLWVPVKTSGEEGGAEVLQFVSTEISTFSHHQSQQQKQGTSPEHVGGQDAGLG